MNSLIAKIFFIFSDHFPESNVVDNNYATDYTNMLLLTKSLTHGCKLHLPPATALRRWLCPLLGARFSKFNCDQCSKHTETPECKACDRMVNYFRIFNMHCFYYPDPKTMPSILKPSAIWPRTCNASSIPI